MIKSFYRLIDKKALILLLLILIASPTLAGKNTYTVCLIYSHYITVYLNNIYLLCLYQYIYRLNSLQNFFITRIGEDKFYLYSYITLITSGLLFNIIIYISYYFFFGPIPHEFLSLTVFFMILNVIINGIENSIIYLQLGHKKNFIYLAIPILINFMFHIIFTQFI